MLLSKKFPKADGWISVNITLKSAAQLERDDLVKIVTFGKPDNYEIGHLSQDGKRALCYSREKPELKAAREKKAMDDFFKEIEEAAKPFTALVNAAPDGENHYSISVKVGADGPPYKFRVHSMTIFTDFHEDIRKQEIELMKTKFINRLPPVLAHTSPD